MGYAALRPRLDETGLLAEQLRHMGATSRHADAWGIERRRQRAERISERGLEHGRRPAHGLRSLFRHRREYGVGHDGAEEQGR